MNARPISAVVKNSAMSPGNIHGRAAPSAMPHEPTTIGRRTPIRSDKRPAPIASHIGRNE